MFLIVSYMNWNWECLDTCVSFKTNYLDRTGKGTQHYLKFFSLYDLLRDYERQEETLANWSSTMVSKLLPQICLGLRHGSSSSFSGSNLPAYFLSNKHQHDQHIYKAPVFPHQETTQNEDSRAHWYKKHCFPHWLVQVLNFRKKKKKCLTNSISNIIQAGLGYIMRPELKNKQTNKQI